MSKLKNIIVCILISCVLGSVFCLTITPKYSCLNSSEEGNIVPVLTTDCSSQVRGGKITLSVYASSDTDYTLSLLQSNIYFDSASLTLETITIADSVDKSSIKSDIGDGIYSFVYLENEEYLRVFASRQLKLMDIDFTVNESASVGTVNFDCSFLSAITIEYSKVATGTKSSTQVAISEIVPPSTQLESLIPTSGELTPKFSPDITSYSITVDSTVSSIEFDAIPKDVDASVKVSRKNLNSPGKFTDIKITVTSSDGKSRNVYTISVFRQEKETSNTDSNEKNDVAGKTSNAKTSSTKSTTGSTSKATSSSQKATTSSKTQSNKQLSSSQSGIKLSNETEVQSDSPLLNLDKNGLTIATSNSDAVIILFIVAIVIVICAIVFVVYRQYKDKHINADVSEDDNNSNKNDEI